jgi:hypothetical protein
MDDVRSGVVGESPAADVDVGLGLGCWCWSCVSLAPAPPTTTDGGGCGAAEDGNLWRVVPASELRCVGAAWLCSPV